MAWAIILYTHRRGMDSIKMIEALLKCNKVYIIKLIPAYP